MSGILSNRTRFIEWRCRLVVLACLLIAAAEPALTASGFSKAPYLQAPGATTMTLLWESLEDVPSKVRYGRGRGLDHVQEVAPPRTMLGVSTRYRTNVVAGVRTNVTAFAVTNIFYVYEAPLTGLVPNTSYTYVVELGTERSRRGRFRTFGESPAEVRFVVYGDSRSQPRMHAALARRFGRYRPDFILHTGDLVARGRDYGLWGREFFDPLAGIIDHIPVLPAIGNHEEDGTNYLAYFRLPPPERWYAFDLGPVHMLALDYHYERASHEQFAFAQRDLRASRAPWKIVFLHVPVFNVGGHASTWGHETYLPLFHETHVDLVIAGHSHVYERFQPVAPGKAGLDWPIVHITSGGGGAPLYPVYDHPALACRASTNHFIVFEATADRLRGRTYLASGKTLDRFELRKENGRPAAVDAASVYPEEWLRAYSAAAPLLRGRLASLPSNDRSAEVTFMLQPLTNAPGPVELDIRVAPDSAADYEWVGPSLRVSVPAIGEPKRWVQAQVRATGRKPVTANPGAELSPPLVFEARLHSGALEVVARGGRSVLSPPASAASVSTNVIALADSFPPDHLRTILVPRSEWQPFPVVTNRSAWLGLPDAARETLIRRGEEALAQALPALPASLYLEYAREGNRSRFEDVYFERRRLLHRLVLAECAEARGRFLDGIANTLWALGEESSWCIPAHVGVQKAGVGLPDVNEAIVDLFAAQTAASVAWTLYLVGPQLDPISPQVRRRADQEVHRRVLTPVREREFGWMGFGSTGRAGRPNNWNPWINANVLTAVLVLERDEARRVQLVHRILRSLDCFLQPYPEDGGCDEGPGYWSRAGGSVLDNLDLLSDATRGKLDVFANPLIGEIGRFILRAHIAGDWFVDIGDGSAKTGIERDLIFRYGRAIQDRQLEALATSGATLPELLSEVDGIDLGRSLHTLFDAPEILARNGVPVPAVRDAWMGSDDMQMMIARDREGSTQGFFVAAWGSHNAQSHNHNDVGNCLVFVDGQPVLIDLGAPAYTAKTFSARRYEILAMQSAYHNLPTINGVQQAAGRGFAARQVKHTASTGSAELSMDIAGAWPADAAVTSWVRTVQLDRGQHVRVTDSFELKEVRGETTLNWITPLAPRLETPGRLLLPLPAGQSAAHSTVALTFDADQLSADLESVALDDEQLESVWGKQVTRIVLRPKQPARTGTWTLRVEIIP